MGTFLRAGGLVFSVDEMRFRHPRYRPSLLASVFETLSGGLGQRRPLENHRRRLLPVFRPAESCQRYKETTRFQNILVAFLIGTLALFTIAGLPKSPCDEL